MAHQAARVIAALAVAADLVFLLQTQVGGLLPRPLGTWSSFILFDLAPVLAMAAFHRDAPSDARWPWLLALTLLAGVAAAWRIVTLGNYVHDPHLVRVSLVELLILLAAARLVIPDAARAQPPAPASPAQPYPG